MEDIGQQIQTLRACDLRTVEHPNLKFKLESLVAFYFLLASSSSLLALMLSEDDPFYDDLEDTLSFQVHRYAPSPEEVSFSHVQPEYPITFYDRHLAANLHLRRVEIIPRMHLLLSEFCEQEIRAFIAEPAHCFDPRWFIVPDPQSSQTSGVSRSVACRYRDTLGKYVAKFPTRLYIHRDDPMWPHPFTIDVPWGDERLSFITEGSFEVHSSYLDPRQPHDLAGDWLSTVQDLRTYSPQLAIWQFYQFDVSGEKLLKAMKSTPNFKWESSQTTCPLSTESSATFSPDGTGSFLTTLLSQRRLRSSAAVPARKRGERHGRNMKKFIGVKPSIPGRATTSSRPYRVDYEHYLQHAWSRAVANDATFIVFNCGKYERIGVRHRASRTLFLSELINTMSCQDPAYGQLHVGLHTAIVQDALNRQERRNSSVSEPAIPDKDPNPLKRVRAHDTDCTHDDRSQKRQKVDSRTDSMPSSISDLSAIRAALSGRDLALVSLEYGGFHSLVPSSFVRLGPSCAPGFYQGSFRKPDRKASYMPHQYFSVTLSEAMGWGSTGTVHRGYAKISTESGSTLTHPVVVKLVFSQPSQRSTNEISGSQDDNRASKEDKVRNEYLTYQHLARANVVDGILPLYGMFEDVESGTLALIMDDGGTSMLRRSIQRGAGSEYISDKERMQLLGTMKSIHRAGIRHCDIRLDNILVNSEGQAFIVDFDRAEHEPSSESIDRELLCMQHIVDGKGDTTSYYSA